MHAAESLAIQSLVAITFQKTKVWFCSYCPGVLLASEPGLVDAQMLENI